MEKILVTGYKGFIGHRVFNYFYSYTMNVTVGLDSDYLDYDDWDYKLINKLNEMNPTVILHIGACSDTLEQDVNYMMKRNVQSTKIITDWAVLNNVKIIYSSSASSYGVNNRYPSNLYGWSKYIGEQYVLQNGGIALRYFNVYGSDESHKGKMSSLAYQMYQKNKSGEEVKLFPGNAKRDFIYIEDVINANNYAIVHYDKLKSQYYDVGTGIPRTFEDVMKNLDINFTYTSEDVIPNGYQFYTCADVSKFMKLWRPKYTLEEGLEDYKIILDGNTSNR